MPKKRPRRKPQGEGGAAIRTGISPQWVVFALVFGLAFGGLTGYFVGSAVSGSGSVLTDAYGRSPSHAHYNHPHP